MNEIVLNCENLSKDFIQGDTCISVLSKLNLQVSSGSIVSITGASGSGKSTLLQILGLLDSSYEGEVYILGQKTRALDDSLKREMRLKNLGFVYQYHHLLKDFSARENIIMPALIEGKNIDLSLSKADEILDRMGMVQRRFHLPSHLSGGEQQRVAIARALFNNPAIILADEPTGNLDPETASMVFDMFIEYARLQKTSVVFVTHNLELASRADYSLKL